MNLSKSQRIFKKQLIHECDVFSKIRVREGRDWAFKYVRIGHDVKCRMSTLVRQNTEGEPNLRHEFVTPYRLYMLPMPVKQDDYILFKGTFYQVKTKPINPSFLDHHYELPCDTTDDTFDIIEKDGMVMLDV